MRSSLISPLAIRYFFMVAHAALLLALGLKSLFYAFGEEAADIFPPIFCGVSGGFALIYVIPAAILCLCHRESVYERGWVEVFYLTFQILWSGVITAFSFIGIQTYRTVQALAIVHTVVLLVWFVWTLWLATRGAKLMGATWTRDLVLRKVGMSKLVRLPQWRADPDIAMNKLDAQA